MPQDHLADLHKQRFTLIDAIRGVAACAVVFRHLFFNSHLGPALQKIFPMPLQVLSIWGAAGVYAFFVLSGFVIAHSLRRNDLSSRDIGNFALRRQLRLDPPYWIVIALTLLLGVLSTGGFSGLSLGAIIANLFYVQNIVHAPAIVNVAWTLCLEIQFYLIFVGILWLASRLRQTRPDDAPRAPRATPFVAPLAPYLVFGLAVVGMAVLFRRFYGNYFVAYWHYFALGVTVYWGLRGTISPRLVGIYLALFALKMVVSVSNWHDINGFGPKHSLSFTGMAVGLATALLIWRAGTRGQLARWGDQPILQWLGRISYSLYLIHPLVLAVVFRLADRAPGSVGLALFYWFISMPLSLGCAVLLNRAVELPSIAFAARLRNADRATLLASAP